VFGIARQYAYRVVKTWMLPLVFPVGLLATVVLVVVSGRYTGFVVMGIGLLLLPVLWLRHLGPSEEDPDTNYWRLPRL
jgi:hypothetical protein